VRESGCGAGPPPKRLRLATSRTPERDWGPQGPLLPPASALARRTKWFRASPESGRELSQSGFGLGSDSLRGLGRSGPTSGGQVLEPGHLQGGRQPCVEVSSSQVGRTPSSGSRDPGLPTIATAVALPAAGARAHLAGDPSTLFHFGCRVTEVESPKPGSWEASLAPVTALRPATDFPVTDW
jgi:hypothetical protein